MNRFLIICLLLLLSYVAYSQAKQKSADELKKEMAQIRQNTNWSNETEANKSQAKIEELSKQLMIIRKAEQQQQAGVAVDSAKLNEEAEYKMGLWKQMMAAVDQGESGDILLAKPLREKIVEAYKNDESPKIKNPEYFEEQTFLCIDMSVPTIQRIIEQMENFKSIKALMITCSKEPVAVDLEDLLARAKNYPLEQLHIINFRQYVNDIPDEIGQFQGLKVVTLLNNNIDQLPGSIVQLGDLQKLYVDLNPISTLMPAISSLNMLDTLGIAKTQISESEIGQIKALLPNCKILDK